MCSPIIAQGPIRGIVGPEGAFMRLIPGAPKVPGGQRLVCEKSQFNWNRPVFANNSASPKQGHHPWFAWKSKLAEERTMWQSCFYWKLDFYWNLSWLICCLRKLDLMVDNKLGGWKMDAIAADMWLVDFYVLLLFGLKNGLVECKWVWNKSNITENHVPFVKSSSISPENGPLGAADNGFGPIPWNNESHNYVYLNPSKSLS